MKPKIRRLWTLLLTGLPLIVGITLLLRAFQENLVFFHTPAEFLKKNPRPTHKMRLGGLVLGGSLQQNVSGIHFVVTDERAQILVLYRGILPDLFREGQGVVVEGIWNPQSNIFTASTVLAKHDENYIPRDVVEGLKKAGRWKGP